HLSRRLLHNPGDVTSNLLYAKESENRDRLRRARVAYERILMADPDNAQAQAGLARVERLLEPDSTDVAVLVGGQMQNNAARLDDDRDPYFDLSTTAQVYIQDDRRLGDLRWATNLSGFASLYNRFRSGDLLVASVDTGPRLGLSAAWTVRPSMQATYARLNRQDLFWSSQGRLDFENQVGGLLSEVHLSTGYEDYLAGLDYRDAWVASAGLTLAWADVGGGRLEVAPEYGHKTAAADSETYHAAAVAVSYTRAVAQDVMAIISVSGEGRQYDETSTTGDPDRRDVELVTELRLLKAGFFRPDLNLIGSYRFEQNFSNNGGFDYRNHTLGVDLAWTF
ncbi:MAG: DUF560 domain-containing protein, partial [Rhodobacterales bacterium]|nr:DUF560 domain-containing protein [Rhodobacterales bacterium]